MCKQIFAKPCPISVYILLNFCALKCILLIRTDFKKSFNADFEKIFSTKNIFKTKEGLRLRM